MTPSEKSYDQIEAWIRECFGILSQDVRRVLANRFPLIADEEALEQHIPIDSVYTHLLDNQNYDALRRGLSNIGAYVLGLGYESSIRSFLDRLTGDAYTLLIFPHDGFVLGGTTDEGNEGVEGTENESNRDLWGILGATHQSAKGYLGNYNGIFVTLFYKNKNKDKDHEQVVRNHLEPAVRDYLDIVLPPYVSYIINISEEEA